MRPHRIKSVTLLELLVSIIILSFLVIVFYLIDLFSHSYVLTSDRRSKIQNDVSYVLGHASKEIAKAIGNENIYGSNTVINTDTISGDSAIRVYIDADGNGIRETTPGTDYWIAYRYYPASAPSSDRYQIRYCPECTNAPCTSCNPSWNTSSNILSKKITAVSWTYDSNDNYVDIQVTACWDPGKTTTSDDCGGKSDKNPSVSMKSRIKMPFVSIN